MSTDLELLDQATSNNVSIPLFLTVKDLMNGGYIQKVSSDEEYQNCVSLVKTYGRVAKDLESEHKAAKEPWLDGGRKVDSDFKPLIEWLKEAQRLATRASSAYAMEIEQKRIAAEREAKQRAEEEQRKLLEEADRKLAEEETKRVEAELLHKAAQSAESEQEKESLEKQAAEITESANADFEAATQASQAALVVEASTVDVVAPRAKGFVPTYDYAAIVNDHRSALTWIVENKEWGLIESKKLRECIESAMNKKAKLDMDKFVAPGCSLDKQPSAKVRY